MFGWNGEVVIIRKVGFDKNKFNYKLMKFLKYIWKIGLLYFWKINWFCIYKEWSVDVIYVDSYCLDKLNEVLNNFFCVDKFCFFMS